MPKSDTNEAVAIASALRPTVDEWGRESSRSCVRAKKMTVASTYNATTRTIGVREAFSATAQNIPCVPGMRGAAVGDPVWVEWLYGDKSTMHVVGPGDLSEFYDGGTNPNILDNWFFVGGGSQQGGGKFPINQRGQTSYSKTTADYTLDRWRVVNALVTVNSGYVNVKLGNGGSNRQRISQIIEGTLLAGQAYTFSALIKVKTNSGGDMLRMWFSDSNFTSIAAHAVQAPIDGAYHLESFTFIPVSDVTNPAVEFISYTTSSSVNAEFDITAVKLEVGSEQTLAYWTGTQWALRELPNITTEILRCQRYQVALNSLQFSNRYVAWAIATSATKAAGIVTLPVPIDRTITAAAPTTWKLTYGATNYNVTAITPYRSGGATCHLDITSSGLTAGRMYMISNVNASDILLLEANL